MRRWRTRFSPAWFAGADLQILDQTPSEKPFYNALGSTVFLLACANGFAISIAGGYMLGIPATHLWWLGLGWTVILCCGVERLVLQFPSTRPRWLPLGLSQRLALSLLIAVLLGEPLMLRINQDAINNQLSIVQTIATRAAASSAAKAHGPRIAADRSQIAAIREHEATLTNQIEHYKFLSSCEADTSSCSTTGKVGCGTYCQHYARMANSLTAQLNTMKPQDNAQITVLRRDISRQRALEQTELVGQSTAIERNSGLIAREEALTAIEKAHPEVSAEVWFWRFLFLTLDLLPLGAKVLRMFATDSPYEALAAAARKKDGVEATRQNEASRVEEELIGEQGRADIDFGRIRISLDNERRIAGEEAGSTPAESALGGKAPRHAGADRPHVSAYSLGKFVDEMSPHETHRIAVDPRLARAGRVGTVLVAALAFMTAMLWLLAHATIAGEWIVFIALGVVASLGVFTKWYVSAPRWALRPILATLVLGLSLPVVIVVMNL